MRAELQSLFLRGFTALVFTAATGCGTDDDPAPEPETDAAEDASADGGGGDTSGEDTEADLGPDVSEDAGEPDVTEPDATEPDADAEDADAEDGDTDEGDADVEDVEDADVEDADDAADDADAADADDTDVSFIDRTTFVNPAEWTVGGDGVYHLSLEPAAVEIDGDSYCLRTWNGIVPGPTLRIPAAASPLTERQVRVDFTNEMTTEDQQAVGPPGPGGVTYDFNQTNLHTHGLHVQPEFTSDGLYYGDNVLVHHPAGAGANYRYDIDEDLSARGRPHESGTFWYHPHVHGTTAIQVANGMAGALIIEGDYDELEGLADAEERIFIITHIPIDDATPLADGETCDDSTLSVNNFALVGAAPSSVQVNGLVRPRIVVPPGQIEHWRLVHAGITQEMNLALYASTDDSCSDITGGPLTVHQIAQDGLAFHASQERDNIYLASGNRADVMVSAPDEDGVYCLAYEQPGAPATPPTTMVVAILETDSAAGAATGALPSDEDLASVALPLLDCDGPVDGTQRLVFSQQVDEVSGARCEGGPPEGPPGGLLFNINCRSFDPDSPRVVNVDQVDEWTMNSESGAHPFHIHINPFMVCDAEINGETLAPHWRDTMLIEEDSPALLRMHYETYTGSFVNHCHKLHHEDQGMMEIVRIED